ncbi:MAG: RnfABCDGE type electron transport complex subunit D [Planctomycetota bacterium]
MTRSDPHLLLQAAPFLRRGLTTPRLMVEVLLGLAPVVFAAIYFFGLSAVCVITAATAGCVATELLLDKAKPRGASLSDGSAVLTGVILGLCLPPGIALWMAFVGGAIAIGLGKVAFGGLGQNLFNPALVGRAFLQAAFPTAITTWTEQGEITEFFTVRASNFALPFMQAPPPPADAVTTATPLGVMKFEGVFEPASNLFLGNIAGSLGETCAVVIIICGAIMAFRRIFDWRIPVSILGTVALFSGIMWAIDSEAYPSPAFMLCSGGLLFGAVYMATDPVTSPLAPRGAWIFGFGVGVLVVLIRLWGGLPEGVMYAILLMNAATPLIDRISQPRPFGRGKGIA